MNPLTNLHRNPFWALGVTPRDDRRKIVAAAEEQSLHLDHDLCQKARADLTNPRTRLAVEMAWMPGVASDMIDKLMRMLAEDPRAISIDDDLPELTRANLMAAAFERLDEYDEAKLIAARIRRFARVVETINAGDVLRDVNADRAISGFPAVSGADLIEVELAERRKAYRSILKDALDAMPPDKLVFVMTTAVSMATDNGNIHGPALIDDLVDVYEVGAQGFLQKEAENISTLIESTYKMVPHGPSAVTSILDKLEKVARNWDRIAQPIQLSARSRGTDHIPSHNLAYAIRGLAIKLNNEHGMADQAHRLIGLTQALFAELPEVAEQLKEDAAAIASIRRRQQSAAPSATPARPVHAESRAAESPRVQKWTISLIVAVCVLWFACSGDKKQPDTASAPPTSKTADISIPPPTPPAARINPDPVRSVSQEPAPAAPNVAVAENARNQQPEGKSREVPLSDADCKRGFRFARSACVAVSIPANGKLDRSGHDWECMTGFRQIYDKCMSVTALANAEPQRERPAVMSRTELMKAITNRLDALNSGWARVETSPGYFHFRAKSPEPIQITWLEAPSVSEASQALLRYAQWVQPGTTLESLPTVGSDHLFFGRLRPLGRVTHVNTRVGFFVVDFPGSPPREVVVADDRPGRWHLVAAGTVEGKRASFPIPEQMQAAKLGNDTRVFATKE